MNSRVTVSWLAAIVLLLVSLDGLDSQAETKKIGTIEGITEYRLNNGMQLLLYPDESKSTVTVNMTIFCGSRHEGYGETGMAHLLEHMLFKGTAKHANVPKLLTDRGASFNGTTWVDRTNYYETLPATGDNLEFAIRFEADRMVNSLIRAEDLASEMTVVRSEFERGENSPSRILEQRMMAAAFEWHNYGKSTIGNRSDIERVPVYNLRGFYQKFYQPDNAMLVVAGRFDEKQALAFVEKYFGSIPRPKRKLPKTYTEEPAQDGERSVRLRRVGEVGLVGVAYHIPSGGHPEFAAVDVMNDILTTPPAGRLYKTLVKTRKAASVTGGAYAWHDPGLMVITAQVRKTSQLNEVRDILINQIQKMADAPPTEKEVDRIKTRTLKQRELSLTNTQSIAIQLSEWAAQGDWRLFFLYRDRIEKVTPAAVHAVAKKYLRQNNRTVGIFVPTKSAQRVAIPATPNLKNSLADYKGRKAIAKGESFEATPENIEARTERALLVDGVRMALLPKKTRGQAVQLRLNLRYGNLSDLKGLQSACVILPMLMARGTKTMSYQQIQDELNKIRATFRATGNIGEASFSIRTTRPNLPAALKLLGKILREASLPKDEFEIIRRSRLTRLESSRSNPGPLASQTLRQILFPYDKNDTRHSADLDALVERYKTMTLDQVRELYNNHLGASEGELAVVGDFDAREVVTIMKPVLSDWKPKIPYSRIPQIAFSNVKGELRKIETPDKANAILYGGLVIGISDDHKDVPALMMGDFILGGGSLSSRLADRIRKKEGLSYGVGSMLSSDGIDDVTRLMVMANSNPKNMGRVVKAMREEFARLLDKGVTKEELAAAKQGFLQSQKLMRNSDGALVGLLASTLQERRTLEYYIKLEQAIAELTPQDVAAALRRHLDPKKLVLVTAGDFKKASAGDKKKKGDRKKDAKKDR